MIRLMVADDHTIMREGLKQLFALVKDISVVAEAENGAPGPGVVAPYRYRCALA